MKLIILFLKAVMYILLILWDTILLCVIDILELIIYIFKKLKNFIYKFKYKDKIIFKINYLTFDKSGRFLIYILHNEDLVSVYESLKGIYNTLMNNKEFINFGEKKIIIVSALVNEAEFNYHHNVLINNNTTFEEYYNSVKDIINTHYEYGYPIDIIQNFKVRVWNLDLKENENIKITTSTIDKVKNYTSNSNYNKLNSIVFLKYNKFSLFKKFYSSKSTIKPLKKGILNNEICKLISTMDVETISFDNKQIPICITICYNFIETKLFIIDHELFKIDYKTAVNNLWKEFFDFIIDKQGYFENIFVHNLGAFDGYFLYKALLNNFKPEEVKTIIDDKNKFIQITFNLDKFKITWKDSYRIFPVSLDNLCKSLKVKGKISKYNPKFNNINLFKDKHLLEEFKEYALQDSICLNNALNELQIMYNMEFGIDITTILSTSTLSLKIFRKRFLDKEIPILNGWIDNFIRNGYYGGATDYYKAVGYNINHYDVNSLYPYAMCNPIPYELIKFHKDLTNYDLNNFFGFCLAEIYCPKDIKIPLLPFRYKNKTIFPTGKWIGVYFSEELKAVTKYGYKIKLIKGYEFSKTDLFSSYVEHFYDKKKFSTTSAERLIAKMQLNQLYGIFGRKQELIETINIPKKDIIKYVKTRIVKTIIDINDEVSTLLVSKNISIETINKLNDYFTEVDNCKFTSYNQEVKSNVAIAAAVTAYARIEMIYYKVNFDVYYTDTDSIFTPDILPKNKIGKGLGLMKNELDGCVIDKAIFLGIKEYGYTYTDKTGIKIDKSTFAGVPKDSLSFQEIESIFNGDTIKKETSFRFFKSFKDLSIITKKVTISIKNNHDKKLIDNNYIPLNINELNHILDNTGKYCKIKNKIIKFFKKFI
jgi:hypothetical protein